ncbi:Basic-leucine zipper domain, partial [Arabidopsis thaliana x Arabidopsis arenosa]
HYHHQQPNVVTDQEKRLRRMATNRESARRSRMRARMMKEVLQMQVKQLMALLEYNHQILQENSQLKETVSSFYDQYTISYGKHEDILGNIND